MMYKKSVEFFFLFLRIRWYGLAGIIVYTSFFYLYRGWSGGAKVLGKLPVPGRPTIWMIVGQVSFALAVGAGGGLFGHFYSPLYFFLLFLPLSGRRPDID